MSKALQALQCLVVSVNVCVCAFTWDKGYCRLCSGTSLHSFMLALLGCCTIGKGLRWAVQVSRRVTTSSEGVQILADLNPKP